MQCGTFKMFFLHGSDNVIHCSTVPYIRACMTKVHLTDMFLLLTACSCACQNGGSCTSPGVCTCTIGWTGRCCETREFCVHDPAQQ